MDSPDKPAYLQIAGDIEEGVLSGRLKPGDHLPSERELVKAYGVSRPTVREALRVLQSNQIIRSRVGDRRGPQVQELNSQPLEKAFARLAATGSENLASLLQFRMVISSAAAVLAAFYRTEADLQELDAEVSKMRAAADEDGPAFRNADLEFHKVLARASRNQLLEIADEAVRAAALSVMEEHLSPAQDSGGLGSQLISHHEELLDAIREQDSVRASWLMRKDTYAHYSKLVDDEDQQALKILADEAQPPGGGV